MTALAACSLVSCNESDTDFARYSIFAVVHQGASGYYFESDDDKTLYPADRSRVPSYVPKVGDRVIIAYNLLEGADQKVPGYDYTIALYASELVPWGETDTVADEEALKAEGEYEARIACNLFSKKGVKFYTFKTRAGCHPYFTQSGGDRENNPDQYIANFCDGATAGFKYFEFDGANKISVNICGNADGVIKVTDGKDTVAAIPVKPCKTRKVFSAELNVQNGVKPLYFTFNGKGNFCFHSLGFN